MVHLVVFDIDGTLIESYADEVSYFIGAVHAVTGIHNMTTDLLAYEHVTDTGIAQQCIQQHFNRLATSTELAAIEEQFILSFKNSILQSPPTAIPGVHHLLENLLQRTDVAVAIATGCYLRSALLKLQHAGLQLDHLPIGSANDSHARIEIMQAALHKAQLHYQVPEFSSLTYVGDGPWDIAAVNTLQWQFIGITSNYPEAHLRQLGAQRILNNYLSPIEFIQHLNLPTEG